MILLNWDIRTKSVIHLGLVRLVFSVFWNTKHSLLSTCIKEMIHTCAYARILTHAHTQTHSHTHMHACTHTCTHRQTHSHTHTHMRTCTCTHTHVCMCTHAHTHTHKHMCARVHIHTHTHMHRKKELATVKCLSHECHTVHLINSCLFPHTRINSKWHFFSDQ